jgi:hypothetical protein
MSNAENPVKKNSSKISHPDHTGDAFLVEGSGLGG